MTDMSTTAIIQRFETAATAHHEWMTHYPDNGGSAYAQLGVWLDWVKQHAIADMRALVAAQETCMHLGWQDTVIEDEPIYGQWTLTKYQQVLNEWADRTFPASTVDSCLEHLRREVMELFAETDPIKRRSECADVLMLLTHVAHKEGWSLEEAVQAKHAINLRRRWGPPDEHGVSEHIRDGAAE